MAKLNGPLLSQNAAGTFAKILTFSNRKTGPQVRLQKAQKNIKTQSQLYVMDRFFNAKTAWQQLTQDEKDDFKILGSAYQLTGYQYFIKQFQGDMLQKKQIHVSADQLKDLHANPVILIPAPGLGKLIHLLDLNIKINFVSQVYDTTNSDLNLQFADSGFPISLEQTIAFLLTIPASLYVDGINVQLVSVTQENLPLLLTNPSVDITLGDSSLDFTMYYVTENI